MTKPTEKFNFSEPILNTTKLGWIRLLVYNSVLNVNRRINQLLYASTLLEDDEDLPRTLSSDSSITSVLNYNHKGMTLLYSSNTPGACEIT